MRNGTRDAAVQRAAARPLRVLIRAEDPAVASELRAMIVAAGHHIVETAEEADVVMSDAQAGAEGGFAAMKEPDFRALLTPREIEVLSAIGEGLTNNSIARRLDISLHTVKFHVESLFRKLGVRTRTEAVAKSSERRLEI
jgi:DNA-binding CsgD family transcriptional regulator